MKVALKFLDFDDDKKISIAVLSPTVLLILQYLLLFYLNINSALIQLSIKFFVAFFYFYAFRSVLKKNKIILLTTYSVFALVFLSHFLIFQINYPTLIAHIFPFFFTCLPSFIYSYSIDDKAVFEKYTDIAAAYIYGIGAIFGLLIYSGSISIGVYSMPYSYYMLLPTIIYLKKYFDTFSSKYLLLVVVALILILTYGSRGPILALAIFMALYQIINFRTMTNYRIIGNFLFLLFLIVSTIFFQDILNYFNNTLAELGIKSRTILLFMKDEINTSGRDVIYEKLFKEILSNPIVGIGITGDRVYAGGSYSHNIFIEIITGFGLILGLIIIAVLLIIIIRALFTTNKQDSNFLLIWFVAGFVPLLVSSTYLVYFQFWIFLGLSLKYLKLRRN